MELVFLESGSTRSNGFLFRCPPSFSPWDRESLRNLGKLRKIETKAISPRLRVVQMVAQFKANKNGHGKMRHLQSHFPMRGFPKSWGYRQSSTFMDDHDLVWINLWWRGDPLWLKKAPCFQTKRTPLTTFGPSLNSEPCPNVPNKSFKSKSYVPCKNPRNYEALQAHYWTP